MMTKSRLVCLTAIVLLVIGLTPVAADQVGRFEFTGNTLVPSATLAEALAPYATGDVTEAQLGEIATCVTRLYFDRGYVARVAATREGDGIRLAVTESKTRVIVKDAEAYSESFVKSHFRHIEDRRWRTQDLEQAMLILRELPGLSGATATLSEGPADQPGTTDVNISLGEGQRDTPLTVSMRVDNFGSPFVSRERIVECVRDTNLTGRGDEIQLQIIHGFSPADLLYGDLRFTLPLSGDGTKLRAYVTAGDFEVGRDLAVLGLHGEGLSFGASASRPLVRTRRLSTTAEVGIDTSDTNFRMDLAAGNSVALSRDRVRKVRLGANWDWLEKEAVAHDLFSVYVHQGLGGFLGGTQGDGGSRLGADNNFTKLFVQAARQQRLSDRTILNCGLGAQFSPSGLLTGEQMAIGGADSVRGYPQAEHVGDSGIQANIELRQKADVGVNWVKALDLVAFMDYGAVFAAQSGTANDAQSLLGVGVGFRAWMGSASMVRLDLGYALADQPSAGGRLQPYVRVEHQF